MTHPGAYPRELDVSITLPNQQLLRIRPLRRCDFAPVREFYGRLSPRSRYLRFFSPMPALPESVLSLITCGDYRQRLALIAELTLPTNGVEIVALGDFGATDDGAAEVGLVVGDRWQRQGIGTALATRVLQAAEARGFDRFVAHVLWENSGVIRKLLNHVGNVVKGTTEHGVSELIFVSR